MTDLTNIAGCFPDVRCLASMAVQSNDIGFGGIMFAVGVLCGLALGLGLAAAFCGKD